MDKGDGIQNPYASVAIPRAQLKSSFIRDTLGEDLDGVVIANQSAVPTYPMYIAQEGFNTNNSSPTSPNGNKIHTQESWRRPYNPYAGDKPQNGGHNDAMYTIDLDRRYKDTRMEENTTGCCCCPCCRCSPCCRKSCCVVS